MKRNRQIFSSFFEVTKAVISNILQIINKLYSRININSIKIFFKNINIPDPENVWKKYIRIFFIKNKEGILGTLALHLIVIIVFLFIRLQALERIKETGLIFEFETELVEVPLTEEEERFKNKEDRRNIAVNLLDQNVDQVEDYTQNYNFNDVEIERIVSENIQKIYEETHDSSIDEYNDPDEPVVLQPENYIDTIRPDSSKTYIGPTNIYYSLENRKVRYLKVPVYKCEGSGKVTVEIKVNQRGYVKDVKILSGDAIDNECLVTAARNAAIQTRFDSNVFAPLRQTGTITYNFIAQ